MLCVREYQSSIAESVHEVLRVQIEELGLSPLFEIANNHITAANGSEFIFAGLRREPRKIRGTENVDVCWVEEGESVSRESWAHLTPTIRRDNSEIWTTFNPHLATDPTYERLITRQRDNVRVVQMNYTDNPWLPAVLADEAEEMRRHDPEAHAHVWLGEPWSRSDTHILGGRWVVDELTRDDTWDGPYYGADWGFSVDPTALVRMWIVGNSLYIEMERVGTHWSNDEIERNLRGLLLDPVSRVRADSARPEIISELRSRGVAIEAADKWEGSVRDGIAHILAFDRIVINPSCTHAIQEARLYRYQADPRTGDPTPKIADAHNHVWDAVRYALSPMIRQRRVLMPWSPGLTT